MKPKPDTMQVQTASLLFCCPDKVGAIASLTNFFAQRDLATSRYVEYKRNGLIFSRVEWALNECWDDEASFSAEFMALASECEASFEVRFMNRKQSVGLFVSTPVHALTEVLNKSEVGYFPNLDISFIVSNNESTQAIADRNGVPFFFISTEGVALEYEKRQLGIINRYKPDYIGLAHYTNILSANFISKADCQIINVIPSFMPSFRGVTPYQAAYDRGVKLIGATAQFVTADLNQGPIIEQNMTRVTAGASVQDMIKMGQNIEQKVFAQAMLKVLEHKVMVHKNRAIIFD